MLFIPNAKKRIPYTIYVVHTVFTWYVICNWDTAMAKY